MNIRSYSADARFFDPGREPSISPTSSPPHRPASSEPTVPTVPSSFIHRESSTADPLDHANMTDTERASLQPSTGSPSIQPSPSGATPTQASSSQRTTARTTPENRTSRNRRSSATQYLPPYLFVPRKSVPVKRSTPPHMANLMRSFNFEDITTDYFGYYITFPHTDFGKRDAERCYGALNGSSLFTHRMAIKRFFNVKRRSLRHCGRGRLPRPPQYDERDLQPKRSNVVSNIKTAFKPGPIEPYTTEEHMRFEEMADSIASIFGYNSMQHFMRSRNLDLLHDDPYGEAKALLLSWRVEAPYVNNPGCAEFTRSSGRRG